MNIEDSYEGAVRRLQRLEMAGIAMASPPSGAVDETAVEKGADRMRELEELATLACEDNERLKGEFGAALQELDDARREMDGARAEIGRAHQELDGARREIEQLRGYVASLEQTLASKQQAPANAPQQAFASTPAPFANAPHQAFEPAPPSPFASPFAASPFATEAALEEDYAYPPKSSGKGALYFFVIAAAGAAIAALCVMRPWDRPHAAALVVEQPTPPPPVVTAPPPAAKVEPTIRKVELTVPKAAPVAVAAHEPRASKSRLERKHAKHHAVKKHGSAKANETAPDTSGDPLGGTSL